MTAPVTPPGGEDAAPGAGGPARRRLRAAPQELLVLLAGLFLVVHYAWLMDDAFVYFRYVDNLVHRGFGLVWNQGEYVEGFSSALWCMLLAVLRALGLDWWDMTRLLGVLLYLAFAAGLVVLNRRLAPRDAPVVNAPLAYLGVAYGVLCYFTSGLETPLVQVAAVAYALFCLRPGSRGLGLFLGTTPLLRHELALPFLMAFAWSWRRERRLPWPMLTSALLVPGGWLVFRVVYYADLFPNTFYLKDRSEWAQGWRYLLDTTSTYHLLPYMAVALLVGAVLAMRAPDGRARLRLGPRALMVAMALVIGVYRVRIGGDPRHFRYLAFSVCLLVCATGGLAEHALAALAPRRAARVAAPLLTLLLAGATALAYPRQLSHHPFRGTEESVTVERINDASGHRHHKDLAEPPWGRSGRADLRPLFAAWKREHPTEAYARIDTHSWCVRMYREYDTRWVQRLGLTDAFLARTDAPPTRFDRPGHKLGLIPLAKDLVRVLRFTGNRPHRGMFREAVAANRAAPWIAANLAELEVLERKVFNTHDPLENLVLAFTFPPRIDPLRRP